jgi:hypothetical protein
MAVVVVVVVVVQGTKQAFRDPGTGRHPTESGNR